MRLNSYTINSPFLAKSVAESLVSKSVYFCMMPLPDDKWAVRVKAEEPVNQWLLFYLGDPKEVICETE